MGLPAAFTGAVKLGLQALGLSLVAPFPRVGFDTGRMAIRADLLPSRSKPAADLIFVYSTYVGFGIVGGHVESFRSVGEEVGKLAVEAIHGNISPGGQIASSSGPVVNWPRMVRWGLDKDRLPVNSLIQNYQPSVWEQYRLEILAIVAVMVLQSATIAALIVQYRRRRRITDELALERLELAHLSRVHKLGELSGTFAHELNQPLTSILANAEDSVPLQPPKPPAVHPC
jgi:signal transduction histidine kinase